MVRPHVVVYVGDLFDEGSTASDVELAATMRRFRAIYPSHVFDSLLVYGDNDVGGEGAVC